MMKESWIKYGFWINFLTLLGIIAVISRPGPSPDTKINWKAQGIGEVEDHQKWNFNFKKIDDPTLDSKEKHRLLKTPQVYLLNSDGEVYCLEKNEEENPWLAKLLEKS